MNQQTNMADTAAADLVRQIATKLYGAAGAEVTDLISLANRVQADVGNPVSPSPAGQGDARAQYDAWYASLPQRLVDDCDEPYTIPVGGSPWDAWQAALAARQPVGQKPALFANRWEMEHGTAPGLVAMRAGRHLGIREFFTVPLYTAPPAQAVEQTFQVGVSEWMGQCFLPSLYSNMTERGDRLLEEVLELLQAHDYDPARVPTLVDYVFSRAVGDPAQEVGGVMVTLAGYCWVAGLDMHAAGDAELARINQPEVMAKIRAKQEAKNALHFDTPLPGNANVPSQTGDLEQMAKRYEWLRDYYDPSVHDDEGSSLLRLFGDQLDEAIDGLIDSRAVKS